MAARRPTKKSTRPVPARARPAALPKPGVFFSYRAEQPDLDLHLKVVPWNEEGGTAWHSHDFYELIWVETGSGLHVHGGARYPVYAGDCFVVMPMEPHSFINARRLHVRNVIFYPEVFERFRGDLESLSGFRRFLTLEPLFRQESSFREKLHLDRPSQVRLRAMLDTLDEELAAKRPGRVLAAQCQFAQILVFLSRCYDGMVQREESSSMFDRREHIVREATAYLEEHMDRDVHLTEVARNAFISPSRLQHVFKQTTGTSLVEYLTKVRVQHACAMLSASGNSVTDVALAVGFQDPSYFGRVFRKICGITPSQFREKAETRPSP